MLAPEPVVAPLKSHVTDATVQLSITEVGSNSVPVAV